MTDTVKLLTVVLEFRVNLMAVLAEIQTGFLLTAALALDGQDALKGGSGNPQALGHGNIIFHGLGDGMAAHHQDAGAPEQVTALSLIHI